MARPCPVERSHPAGGTRTSGPGGSSACRHPGCPSAQTFYSRDALRNSEAAQQIQQFYDSVQRDATTPLSSSCPNWRALSGSVDPGSRSRHGPFCSSVLRLDARVLPPYDDAAAAFFVWYSQLGTGTDRIINYTPVTTIISVPSLTIGWPSRCGTCRADYQAWLLAQTERITSAAESGDSRLLVSVWSARSRASEDDWSHGLSWTVRAFLRAELMAGAFLHGVWPQGQN